MATAGESQQATHTSPAPAPATAPATATVLPPPLGEGRPCQPPPFPSDPAVVEWETMVQAWLATLPTRRNVNAAEMDVWIDSRRPPLLPESLQCLPRSHLHARILTLHKLLRGSVVIQEKSGNEVGEQTQPRFVRTDQWLPVYSWLESLEAEEVVKSKEISEWLAGNPDVKDQLFARHSRYHLMHYIQKLHLKMLRKRDKLKKGSQAIQTSPAPTEIIPVIASNCVVALPETQRPAKIPTDGCKDEELYALRKNEALLRYELLSDLQNRLINHFAKHKQNGSLKGAGLISLTAQQPMQIPVTSVGNAESFPAATSTLDVKIGKKRKASTQDSIVVIPPVLSAVSDATF